MEEEEDRILLSSLGVTSANPEDIERDVLAKVSALISIINSILKCYCFVDNAVEVWRF